MPTSDNQLNQKREAVEALRRELEAKEREVLRLQAEKENDLTASALDQESVQLKAMIAVKDDEIKAMGGAPSKVEVPAAPVTRSTTESGTAESSKKKEG